MRTRSTELRPLVSPVLEYRWIGIAYLASGSGFGLFAVLAGSTLEALFTLLFFGSFFGAAMYLFTCQRNVIAAVESLGPPPTAARETRSATLLRIARDLSLTCALLVVLSLVSGRPDYAGGALLGMGGALLLTSAWLHRWQMANPGLLLREPRNRWTRAEDGSFGRGNMDRRDFYLAESSGENVDSPDARLPQL